MRKLIIGIVVAAITFVIGITISRSTNSPAIPKSTQFIKSANTILVKPRAKELPKVSQVPKVAAQGSDLSIAIQVGGVNPDSPSYELRHLKLAKHGPTIIELDLAEYVDNSEVKLNFRDRFANYRIFQQYRTSLSISAEGPHLDLVDWRHFDSPWTPLTLLGPGRFRTMPANQMQDAKFPPTSRSAIVREVRRRVGKDWPGLLELAKGCGGPNDGACHVGVSSVYLRIQKQVQTRWVNVGMVEFKVPMGC
jgi:hypothetical protein